jgi:hypothetical protein
MSKPAHLPGEDVLEPVVVADCGQNRCVGGQSDRRQGIAIELEPGHEFGSDVLRIGGAAAISGEQELMAGPQSLLNGGRNLPDRRMEFMIVRGVLQHARGATEMLRYGIVIGMNHLQAPK